VIGELIMAIMQHLSLDSGGAIAVKNVEIIITAAFKWIELYHKTIITNSMKKYI
jgi:hypothetical protein